MVGAKVRFLFPRNGNTTQFFQILQADGATIKLMKEKPEMFPKNAVQAIANLMPARLAEVGVKIHTSFKIMDWEKRGYITIDQFRGQIAVWAIDLGFVDKGGLSSKELDQLVDFFNADGDR